MTNDLKNAFLFLMAWLCFVACSERELSTDDLKREDEGITVRMVVSTPRTSYHSRGGGRASDTEAVIREIQVLVFEEGLFKYRVPGISISNSDNSTSFTVRLLSSSHPLDLYIVANATEEVSANAPIEGQSMEAVRNRIQGGFTTEGLTSVLPMAGSCRLPNGLGVDQPAVISGIRMLRAVARADVLLSTADRFELVSIQAFRANNRFQLIPTRTDTSALTPQVPADSEANVDTDAIGVSATDSVARLYLPESAAPAAADRIKEATCLVIGGKFGGSDKVTYYRVDFDPDNQDNRFGQILRNHCYIFTVKGVAGPGWPTPEDAANNRSAQINLEIQDWDQTTADLYFDTEHYFGVSSRTATLKAKENSLDTIFVTTDLDSYTLQWADATGKVSGNPAESLADAYFKVEKFQQGRQLVITSLQTNLGNAAVRTGYFVIDASRWRILMTINQENKILNTKVISLLSFRNNLGYLGVNSLLPLVTPDGRGAGLRGILDNLNDFGPTGTVPCIGFNVLQSNSSANTLTEAGLAVFDVIYFNYVSSSAQSAEDVRIILEWLEADKRRVMIVTYDGSSINIPLMKALLGTTDNVKWFGSNTGPYPLVGKSESNFFTDTGPFTTSPYTPVAEGFSFQNYDAYHGEIMSGSAGGITPVLMGPGGGIVLGIDMGRRIVYAGDVDLFTYLSGTGSTTNNHITNNTGTINNDASKLIANLFAWIVDVVNGQEDF